MSNRAERYRKYASHARVRLGFDATLLKFNGNTGEWSSGKDEDKTICNDRQLLADADGLMEGYLKFVDRKPVYAVTRVAAGVEPPSRSSLGDNNKSAWPVSDSGAPEDPWKRVAVLPLIDPETDEIFIISLTTAGGLDATGMLADAYAFELEQRPEADVMPLVGLSSDWYTHKKGRRIYNPLFEILRWLPRPDNVRRLTPPPLPLPQIEDQRAEFGYDAGPDGANGYDQTQSEIPF